MSATAQTEKREGFWRTFARVLGRFGVRPQRKVEIPLCTIEANIDGMIFCERRAPPRRTAP